jgi:hypothetical protein
MATARPFAYNPPPNAVIAGTEQVGSLAVGIPTSGFTNNPQFWNGPDEELGYVIAVPVSGNTQPTPIFGVFASVGFKGTKNMTNPLSPSTFLELVNSDAPSPPGPFTSATEASIFLTTNGFWNSYPTSGVSGDFNVTISQVGPDVVWNGSGSFNLAALTFDGVGGTSAGYESNLAIWAIGPGAPVDTYIGTITYPLTFGTNAVPVTSASGSTFGILPGGSGRSLYVPSGYVSNTNISGTATYINTTIASAGLTPGTYTWSWGTGGNTSTVVMTISS